MQGIQGGSGINLRTEARVGGDESHRHGYILGSERKTGAWSEMAKRQVVGDLTGEISWYQTRQGFEVQAED